jgi:uncharacterized protein (TIGR02611 family)
MERVRARKALHKQRSRTYRVAVGTAGSSLVLVGLFLAIPGVPGPGLLVVVMGLGMLALEFDRAERLLERLVHRVEDAGEAAARASRVHKALAGLLALAAVGALIGAVLLLDLRFLPI